MFSPVPTSGTGNWDQLLPFQCSAPVLMACTVSFVLPTTQTSLLAMVAIAEGLRRCALLATVLQEGPQTRPLAPGTITNSERLAAKSPTNNGASTLRYPVLVIIPAPPVSFGDFCALKR